MKIASVTQMRQLDESAIHEYGIPAMILMENAGIAVYDVIARFYGVAGKRFVVFCGSGHNGGDGFAVARKLHSSRGQVQAVCLGSSAHFDELVQAQVRMVELAEIPIIWVDEKNLAELQPLVEQADVVVDALLGTGLSRPVSGKYQQVIAMINASDKAVVSVDIPSGIHGDTGQVMGVAVRARHTITFGLPKTGNLIYPGFDNGGQLHVSHISFPPQNILRPDIRVETSPLPIWPERPGNAHKGSCGKVLLIAGAANYQGAPTFAAMSFLRAGGGLSYLATPRSVAPFIAAVGHEIVLMPQSETTTGSLARSNLDALLTQAKTVDMVVLGPGVSLHPETQELVRELVRLLDTPLLIDGDGLSAVAAAPELLGQRQAPTVLTPHPGEMARLLAVPVSQVSADRMDCLRQGLERWGVHVILKGAHSLIGQPDGRIFVNLSGNAGMATAGSGDVLTGTIAAMFAAAHFDFSTAVRTGVFLHGLAGDLAAGQLGPEGVIASDILAHLPAAIQHYRRHYEEIVTTQYGKIAML